MIKTKIWGIRDVSIVLPYPYWVNIFNAHTNTYENGYFGSMKYRSVCSACVCVFVCCAYFIYIHRDISILVLLHVAAGHNNNCIFVEWWNGMCVQQYLLLGQYFDRSLWCWKWWLHGKLSKPIFVSLFLSFALFLFLIRHSMNCNVNNAWRQHHRYRINVIIIIVLTLLSYSFNRWKTMPQQDGTGAMGGGLAAGHITANILCRTRFGRRHSLIKMHPALAQHSMHNNNNNFFFCWRGFCWYCYYDDNIADRNFFSYFTLF